MTKTIINTADAPQAIGTYSQAVKVDTAGDWNLFAGCESR